MEAIRIQKKVEKRGELTLRNLPVEKGEEVEVLVLRTSHQGGDRKRLTARQLLESDVIGMWEDRTDISDSSEYARGLRDKAQRRSQINGVEDDSTGQ